MSRFGMFQESNSLVISLPVTGNEMISRNVYNEWLNSFKEFEKCEKLIFLYHIKMVLSQRCLNRGFKANSDYLKREIKKELELI